MNIDLGQLLSLWCVRLALSAWFLFAWFALTQDKTNRLSISAGPKWSRQVNRYRWTWGCATILYVAHVALAFIYFHAGSHRLAAQHVAERTFAFSGVSWSGGIWFNHAFSLLVVSEAIWWFWSPRSRWSRPPWVTRVLYGFVLFMIVNAGIIFVTGPVRWINLIALLTLVAVALWQRRANRQPPSLHGNA